MVFICFLYQNQLISNFYQKLIKIKLKNHLNLYKMTNIINF
jgi:hypothetical protein